MHNEIMYYRPESPIKDSFEFGIIAITEADKEQKNMPNTLKDSSDSSKLKKSQFQRTLFPSVIISLLSLIG